MNLIDNDVIKVNEKSTAKKKEEEGNSTGVKLGLNIVTKSVNRRYSRGLVQYI